MVDLLVQVYGQLLTVEIISKAAAVHAHTSWTRQGQLYSSLNNSGEVSFLFASDNESLLDLVDDYIGDIAPTGNTWPSLL